MIKKIGLGLIAILVIIQFFRIDKTNPPVDNQQDFISLTQPSEDIKGILKSSCYDCHSNETVYPWYTNIAPVSWWIEHHIDEGREHLNFSEWGTYSAKKANHKLEECFEEVEEEEMPLSSYTLAHGEAKLTKAQREQLVSWFRKMYEDTKVAH